MTNEEECKHEMEKKIVETPEVDFIVEICSKCHIMRQLDVSYL